MDAIDQSVAARSRRILRGRVRPVLLAVLALLALLPAGALGAGLSASQSDRLTAALSADTTTEDQPPVDPAPADPAPSDPAPSDPAPTDSSPSEPAPAPSDPAPSDPAPAPSDPAPAPSDPAPAPSDPAPAPSDPAPAPSDPAPAPSDPAPAPSDPAPAPNDPAPAPSDPAPAPTDPAPRDARTPAKQTSAPEQQVATPGLATLPVSGTPNEPLVTAPARPAAATTPAAGDRAASKAAQQAAKAVRDAFARLGLGTIAAPKAAGGGATVVIPVPVPACAPGGMLVVTPAPTVSAPLATHTFVHPRRAETEPPRLRGPPAPLDLPVSPVATAGGGGIAAGSASSDRDAAIHADEIVFELADGVSAVDDRCDAHVAPAPASAAARAPPVA